MLTNKGHENAQLRGGYLPFGWRGVAFGQEDVRSTNHWVRPVGFEPTTRGLKGPCSATELRPQCGAAYGKREGVEHASQSLPHARDLSRRLQADSRVVGEGLLSDAYSA